MTENKFRQKLRFPLKNELYLAQRDIDLRLRRIKKLVIQVATNWFSYFFLLGFLPRGIHELGLGDVVSAVCDQRDT